MYHSNRGTQYVCLTCSDRLVEFGVTGSVGAVGGSYGNAMAASVNAVYMSELIKPRKPWCTVDEVEFATFE